MRAICKIDVTKLLPCPICGKRDLIALSDWERAGKPAQWTNGPPIFSIVCLTVHKGMAAGGCIELGNYRNESELVRTWQTRVCDGVLTYKPVYDWKKE